MTTRLRIPFALMILSAGCRWPGVDQHEHPHGGVPRRPNPVIESPKGSEHSASLRKLAAPAAPKVTVLLTMALSCTWAPTTNNPASNVVFVVFSSTNLAKPLTNWTSTVTTNAWPGTNLWPFPVNTSLPGMFYGVRSSNTVTNLASSL